MSPLLQKQEKRAVSEPPPASAVAVPVLSGGEAVSLSPVELKEGESPMPELLSLKDRLKLFEKEIEQQHIEPEPKKDTKFSFLSDHELNKMKEEEAKRIQSMTMADLEAFDSLTSQLSIDDQHQQEQDDVLEQVM